MEFKPRQNNIHHLRPYEHEADTAGLSAQVNAFLLRHNDEIAELPNRLRSSLTRQLQEVIGEEDVEYDELCDILTAYQVAAKLGKSTADIGPEIGEPSDLPDQDHAQEIIQRYEERRKAEDVVGRGALEIVVSNSAEAVAEARERAASRRRHPSARKRAPQDDRPVRPDVGELPEGVIPLPRRRSDRYRNPLDGYSSDE